MSIKQKEKIKQLEKINKLLRYWILDMTTTAGSGHPTSSLSAVELMSTLMYSGVFKYNTKDIHCIDNDRLIFSKGHASPLYYALWAGCDAISSEELNTFRKFDSNLEGHPTMRFPFTEAATGSLGQGLSVGIGIALAQKKLDETNARTYVLLGDSEMAEGQAWEAMNIATYYELDNLVAIVDVNRLGQRGETMIGHNVEIYAQRARAFGWRTVVVDGHNIEDILRVYTDVIGSHRKPLMIIAKTYKGKGVSFLENKNGWHGKTLSEQEFTEAIGELGEIDFTVRSKLHKPQKTIKKVQTIIDKQKNEDIEYDITQKYATRDAYGVALVEMMKTDGRIIVLDAEVSNSTRADKVKEYFPERFFEMFIAEQNMVSVAVGLSRRGYKPYVSTFAAFLTRAHDQIRMASLNESKITFVGSHAGVSIGADGGSQMGLSDIAMFRTLLNSTVFYPSDVVSAKQVLHITKELQNISYVRTTREKTALLYSKKDKCEISGLRVMHSSDFDDVVVFAAGITLQESLKAYEALKLQDIKIRVVDLYCLKPIDVKLIIEVIGNCKTVIVVEDHYEEGGMGAVVQKALVNFCGEFVHLCVKEMPRSGTPDELLQYEKIDFSAIMESVNKTKNN
jgi:transketolase